MHLLTVVHSTERSGPPILALRFLRWLSEEHPGWALSTISLEPAGELSPEFAELGPITSVAVAPPGGPGSVLASARNAATRLRSVPRGIDVAHVHCAGSMRIMDVLGGVPVLCHLHELDIGFDLHTRERARRNLLAADRFVAVSDAVRSRFLDRFPVEPTLVERQWGFTDPAVTSVGPDRDGMGVAPATRLVVGSGFRHWRKAPEAFVRTAIRTRSLAPDVDWRFIWVGGHDEAADSGVGWLVGQAGLDDLVQFVDHREDSLRWIASADAFFLSAREDAFPLVCVEAAALGVPIVTFESGGAADLVRSAGCGAVVPMADVGAAANAVVSLLADRDEARAVGDAGRRFAAEHLTIDAAGPALVDQLRRAAARQ